MCFKHLMIVERVNEGDEPPRRALALLVQCGNVSDDDCVEELGELQVVHCG